MTTCPDCADTGWIPPEMTEEHPRQSACMRRAALGQAQDQITSRDIFAAAALAGLGGERALDTVEKVAALSFTMADAMMAERAKR